MSHNDTHAHEHHGPGYGLYWMVWLTLVGLTGITVMAAVVHLGVWTVPVAMAIATIKSALVLWYFMHLKYESALFKGMILVCFITFAIFVTLTFIDIGFRP